ERDRAGFEARAVAVAAEVARDGPRHAGRRGPPRRNAPPGGHGSVMMPLAVAGYPRNTPAAPAAFARVAVKVSLPSVTPSLATAIEKVLLAKSPSAQFRVPEALVKSV